MCITKSYGRNNNLEVGGQGHVNNTKVTSSSYRNNGEGNFTIPHQTLEVEEFDSYLSLFAIRKVKDYLIPLPIALPSIPPIKMSKTRRQWANESLASSTKMKTNGTIASTFTITTQNMHKSKVTAALANLYYSLSAFHYNPKKVHNILVPQPKWNVWHNPKYYKII